LAEKLHLERNEKERGRKRKEEEERGRKMKGEKGRGMSISIGIFEVCVIISCL
jgi:hypothetical protein